jgi:hypothetical protein
MLVRESTPRCAKPLQNKVDTAHQPKSCLKKNFTHIDSPCSSSGDRGHPAEFLGPGPQKQTRRVKFAPRSFSLVARAKARLRLSVMGEPHLATGARVDEQGIYQSACACRSALTLLAGQQLPRCLGCDEAIEWRLVQRVRPSTPIPPRLSSTTRLRAAQAELVDKASSDE